MLRSRAALAFAPFLFAATGVPAHASGLGAEANYAHVEGRDGAELGAGFALGLAGFSLTPGGGVLVRDGDTKLYGRIEAAYSLTLPAAVTVGVGLRVENEARVYGTVAFPILPKLAIKGNLGDHYAAIGLRLGY